MSAPALPHLTQPCAVHATHTQEGRRGQRLDRRCRRDANHEVPRRAPPLGPAERFARSLDENCNRSLNTFSKKASSTRRWMPCPWPREVASTDAEHTNLTAPEHVSTNAPGRIERSREHSNLAVTRHAPRAPAPAPRAPASAPSRREPCSRDSHARRQTRSAPRPPLPSRREPRGPPFGPAGRFARTSKRSLDPTTRDAMRRARRQHLVQVLQRIRDGDGPRSSEIELTSIGARRPCVFGGLQGRE